MASESPDEACPSSIMSQSSHPSSAYAHTVSGYPVRSVPTDDHVSTDMKTPLRRHTVSCAISVVYLHDQTDTNWAHGVMVPHPLRMRKAQGSNPSVSMHMCMHDSDGSRDYWFAHMHTYVAEYVACTHACVQTHTPSHVHQPVRCVIRRVICSNTQAPAA